MRASHLLRLVSLDLSHNDMDEAAEMFRAYLDTPSCTLQKLCLVNSDIDDWECAKLMKALEKNKSLRHLELAHNLIGSAEMLNVVNPDLVTGGEAIADMLQMNKTLEYLDVSWNTIRKDSAVALGEALRYNKALKTLILAQNAFTDLASQQLGDSLALNDTLTHLDLSYNAVPAKAAMVLANAFKTFTITHLELAGNTSASAAPSRCSRRCGAGRRPTASCTSASNCGVDTPNPGLDPIEPTGGYSLPMTTPYARMVAAELLRLAKTRRRGASR